MPVGNAAILTVSDRCSRGDSEDRSGPALKQLLLRQGFVVLHTDCVPDEQHLIEDKLRSWSHIGSHVTLILTTGGTGFAPRDVTPEATIQVVDRLCPAITTAMTVGSLKVTPMAMLSRAVCGIKNSTLIINLPGSVKGAIECLEIVMSCFPHATDVLKDSKYLVDLTHSSMQSSQAVHSKVSTKGVADRQRSSPWKMITMEEATNIVLKSVKAMETTVLPLAGALGYITSEDVCAAESLPPFRASMKDGYAIHSSGKTGIYKVVSALSAGSTLEGIPELKIKECIRVNTGGPIPAGADAVVPVENTSLVEKDAAGNEILVNIHVEVAANQDIRAIGCDIAQGEVVLPQFTEIRSAEHGILAAAGASSIPVFRKPVVAVLSTGNELVPAGTAIKPGTVWDSNMLTLRSLLTEHGFESLDMGIAQDEPDILLRHLKRSLTSSDVVVTTGSVSMGDKDYLKDVLKIDLGADIKFGRINMKPGKPTTFATLTFNDKPKIIFALPGNPVSATVMTHLLVIPALKKMSGHQHCLPLSITAKMDFDMTLDERPEYHRAILDFSTENDVPRAKSTGSQISSRLLSWRLANCLLVLPSRDDVESGRLTAGDKVRALVVEKLTHIPRIVQNNDDDQENNVN